MPYQPIKFYQTGSFAAGNRLLAEDQRSERVRGRRGVPADPREDARP
jgi:hypothetical protein